MKLELVVAIIAGVVAVVSAAIAYMAQASATKSQAQVAMVQLAAQGQKPFAEVQMKFYFEATETATQIPRTTAATTREKLVQRFWQLYWGPLAVVEDGEVEAAMVAYGQQLKKDPRDAASLETLSLELAHACRSSLKRLWVPELGSVQNIRPPAE